MKNLLSVLLIGISLSSFGQSNGKWSTGLSYTPSIQGGATFAVNINRHFGEKWQVGLMPFGWFYGYENPGFTSLKANSLGLNITSRFSPIQTKLFKPYFYSFAGYGRSTFNYSNPNYPQDAISEGYLSFSIGAGTELNITNGWSLDVNLGYLGVSFFNNNEYSAPVFSVGFLKRVGK